MVQSIFTERKLKNSGFKDCIEKGLLRRIPCSKEKAEGSIKAARRWLREARVNLENEVYNSSLLSSYLAMFHSARAILYLDGYREKSHYCVGRYIEEKYVRKGLLEGKWIELLDHYRSLRHRDQYSVNFYATGDEAKKAIETAEDFISIMKNLLQSKT